MFLFWEQDMPLNGTYTLCIVGMNSTLISSERDHVDETTERPMRLSLSQIPKRRANTIFSVFVTTRPSAGLIWMVSYKPKWMLG